MPKRMLAGFVFLTIALIAPVSGVWSGQVLTPDIRQWAKDTVAREKSLQAVDTGHTLAVLYFQNRTADPRLDLLQKGLAIMLTTDLAKVEDLHLVERVKLQALIEEMTLGTSGLVESDSAPRIGRLLGAGYLVGGNLSSVEATGLKIRSDLLNVPQEKIFGRPEASGNMDRLFELEKEILLKIIAALQIEMTPERKALLMQPLSSSVPALMHLFRGIDKSDTGDYVAAAHFYNQALEEDSHLQPAADNLKELQALGLWHPQKRSTLLLKSLQSRTSLNNSLSAQYPTARLSRPATIHATEIPGYLFFVDDDYGTTLFYRTLPYNFDYYAQPVTADYILHQAGPDRGTTYYGISKGEFKGEYPGAE